MKIAEFREKAASYIRKAAAIRDDKRPWSEKQEEFNQTMKLATDTQKEIQTVEAQEAALGQLTDLERQYLEPANRVKEPAPDKGTVNVGEAFGHYVRGKLEPFAYGQRLDHKLLREACLRIHREAFGVFLREGDNGFYNFVNRQKAVPASEMHALLSTDQTLGGFLVPDDWRAEVIKAEAGYAVLVPLCRTEPTNRDTLVFPKMTPHASDSRRTSGFAGKWQAQGYVTGGTAPTVQNYPKFSQERIPVHSWQPDAVEISPELLEDSGANVEQIVAEAIGECLAFDKDDVILEGTGVNQPEGIVTAGITTVPSGGATSIAYAGIINTFTNVPAQYRRNATWLMASKSMGAILKLNTGTGGMYLFPPNQWNNTILGRPVSFLDYGMDEPASDDTFTAGHKPIIFGDFRRYIIAQRAALRVQRLVERFAPNVGFLPTARLGGQVVLTQAFRIMTIAAS